MTAGNQDLVVHDTIAITEKGELLVHFEHSGMTKKFNRIHIGSLELHGKHQFATSLHVENEKRGENNFYQLIIEAQEYDFRGHVMLRSAILETFPLETTAYAAIQRVRDLFETKGRVEGTVLPSKRRHTIEDAMMIACGAGLFMLGVGALVASITYFHKFY